jgi:hypothetical protein
VGILDIRRELIEIFRKYYPPILRIEEEKLTKTQKAMLEEIAEYIRTNFRKKGGKK